ncbi:unnamed protein product [Phytomonas sp. EM1]|nr:unnamed protein product [Phytomonas sp. EM1]|eukprot:CCW65732.1 unnamed protein product [Phytomonas sp. isolate EM1]
MNFVPRFKPTTHMRRPVLRALVECGVTNNPSVGFRICEQNVVFNGPFADEEAVFRFDSLHHYSTRDLEDKSPVVDVLKDHCRIDTSTAGAAHSPLFLFHGPFLSSTATIFIHTVERALCELAHSHLLLGADMRLVRVYSWGAADVIAKRIIEQSRYRPPRYSGSFADSIDCSERLQICFEHLEQELLRVRGLLRDALIVPEGHCAIICVISTIEYRVERAHTLHLYLLPPLRSASRLLKKDLWTLRSAWCESPRPPSLTATNISLARFLMEGNSKNTIHVFTVLGSTSVQNAMQDFHLQCCYGCRIPSDMLEKYCYSPLVSLCSALELQPQTISVRNNCTVSGSHTVADATARRLALSVSNSVDGHSDPSKKPIPIDNSFPGVGPIQGILKSHPWNTRTTVSMEEVPDHYSISEPEGSKERLPDEMKALQEDVQHLEQYKMQLENAVGLIFESLKDVTDDLAVEESAMLTEIERAASILGLAEASSRAQEQQILSRLTALLSNSRISCGSVKSDQVVL